MIARRYLSQTPEFSAAVERRRSDAMTSQQMRAANPLISTSPNYQRYLDAKREREMRDALLMVLLKPLTIFFAAVAGAHEEHQRMLHAPAAYLGRGHD